MTHINYKNLKDRMCEMNKGFWKVQSIHKLKAKLKIKYNPKDHLMLKRIQKTNQQLPVFLSVRHEKSPNKIIIKKNFSHQKILEKDFFLTTNNKNKINEENTKKENIIYKKIYGKFMNRPFLLNDFQFIFLSKEKRLFPRTFKDVLKDCIALREYKKHINRLRLPRVKDASSMSTSEINNNSNSNNKQSMTIICKRYLSDNEIMDNVFSESKNEYSFKSDKNLKIVCKKKDNKEIIRSAKNLGKKKIKIKIMKSISQKNFNLFSISSKNFKNNIN